MKSRQQQMLTASMLQNQKSVYWPEVFVIQRERGISRFPSSS